MNIKRNPTRPKTVSNLKRLFFKARIRALLYNSDERIQILQEF